jgi:cytochrome c-type biogenesis protein CcmH
MRRRDFLVRAGALGLAGIAAAPARAQNPEADRLRIPEAVQRRAAVTDWQNDETVKAIERRLKCTCGCNLDIFTCRTTDFTCGTSPELHKEVVALLEAGNGPDEVVAAFVAKHGEEVLMAPVREGFNWAGYLLPGTVLVVAGSVLGAVLVRRHRLARHAEAAIPVPADPDAPVAVAGASEEELRKLKQALQEVAG